MRKTRAMILTGLCVVATGCLGSVTPAAAAAVQPLTSSGCTGDVGNYGTVCITIYGTKLHVDYYSSTYTPPESPDCASVHPTTNPSQAHTPHGEKVCVHTSNAFYTFETGKIIVNANFTNNTDFCAYWDYTIDGYKTTAPKACRTIHS